MLTLTAVVLMVSACSANLSSRAARQQIAELGMANLDVNNIQVQRIVTQLGGRAIAEANVRLAFQFDRNDDGKWIIVSARLGDREWIDIETLLGAIELQNTEETTNSLNKLSAGLVEYWNQNGSLPEVSAEESISDVLHPLFMTDLIRADAWGASINYRAANNNYELRSPGPDGVIDNNDDIVRIDELQ